LLDSKQILRRPDIPPHKTAILKGGESGLRLFVNKGGEALLPTFRGPPPLHFGPPGKWSISVIGPHANGIGMSPRFTIRHLPIATAKVQQHGGIIGYIGTGGYLLKERNLGDSNLYQGRSESYLSAPRVVDACGDLRIGGRIGHAWEVWGIDVVTDEHRQRLADGNHPVTGEKVVRQSRGKADYTLVHELDFTFPKELSLFVGRPELAEGIEIGMKRVVEDIESRALAAGHRNPVRVAGLAGEWQFHPMGRGADGVRPDHGPGGVPHAHVHSPIYSVAPLESPRTHAVGRISKRNPERERKTKTVDHGRFDARRAFANREDAPRLEALFAQTVIDYLRKNGWILQPPTIGSCPGVGLVGWEIITPDGQRPTQAMVDAASPRRRQIEADRARPRSPALIQSAKKRIAWTIQNLEFQISSGQEPAPLIGVGHLSDHMRFLTKEGLHERRLHQQRTRALAQIRRLQSIPEPLQLDLERPGHSGGDSEAFVPAIGKLEKPKAGRVAGWSGKLPGSSSLDSSLRGRPEALGATNDGTAEIGSSVPVVHPVSLGGSGISSRQSESLRPPGPSGLRCEAGSRGRHAAHVHRSPGGPSPWDSGSARSDGHVEPEPGNGSGSRSLGGGGCFSRENLETASFRVLAGLSLHDWLDDPAQKARFLDYIRLDAEVFPFNAPRERWTSSMLEAVVKSPYAMGLSLVLHEYLERYGELDSLSDVKSRGMIRLESWLAATDGELPLSIWPKMRQLTYRELRGTDLDLPAMGDLCYAPSRNLWLPFQEASRSAVTALKGAWMRRAPPKPKVAPIPINPTPSESKLNATSGELLMTFDDVGPIVTGYLPAVETLEDIEFRIVETAKRRNSGFDQYRLLDQSCLPKIPRPKL